MLFVFMLTCFQVCMLVASNDNNNTETIFSKNSAAANFLKKYNIQPIDVLALQKKIDNCFSEDRIDILAQPKSSINSSSLNSVTSTATGIGIISNSELKNESQSDKYSWLSSYYDKKEAVIQQKVPHLVPYFDLEILQLLADVFDKEQVPDNVKELYIWTIFLDTAEIVFSRTYQTVAMLLTQRRFDGTIPFNFLVAENDSYKKIIKEALKECLETKILYYEKTSMEFDENNNPQKPHSLIFTRTSSESLVFKIIDKVDNLLQLKVQEYHDKKYTSYSKGKVAEWIDDYVKKTLQVESQNKISILRRIAYDIDDLTAIDLNEEEEKQLVEVKKIVFLNNQEKKHLEQVKKITEQNQKQMISYFYDFLQTTILEKLLKEFNLFNEKYSLNIQDEEVSCLITAIFKNYPYNIFHVNPQDLLMVTKPFANYLIRNFIENANYLVEDKKLTKQLGGSEFIPRFSLQEDVFIKCQMKSMHEEKNFNLAEFEKKQTKATASQFRAFYLEELKKEEEEKNKRLTQEIASRVQASYLEQCRKEKEEEENKRLKQEKATANKIKREEEERALQDEQEQKEAARKQRQEQQNSLRQVAGQELQKLKNDRLKILAEKRAVLYDYKNEAKELEAFDVVGLIDEVSKAIEEQQKLITKSNNKVIKKILSESLSSYQKIDVDILAIEKRLQDRKESPKQNTNNESLAMDLVSIEQEESKKDNLIENHTIAAVVVGTLNQPKKIKRYTHNPYDPDYTFVRKQSNVADKKLDDVSNDPFAEKVLVSGTSKNSDQKLLTQNSDNLPASSLGWVFYPEKYQKKESSQNNSCYPDENEATEKVELYDCSCLNTKSAVLGQDRKCINCRLKR